MTIVFYEPNAKLDKADDALNSSAQGAKNYAMIAMGLSDALSEAELEFMLNFVADSDATDFRELQRLVLRNRDYSLRLVKAAGDLSRDMSCIAAARSLLSANSAHIVLVENLEKRKTGEYSLGKDVSEVQASFLALTQAFSKYRSTFDEVMSRYQSP